MYRTKINRIIQVLGLIALITLGLRSAQAFDNSNGPELPAQCGSIVVPEGNKLAFHAYAKGAQIYKWNVVTQTWDLVAPTGVALHRGILFLSRRESRRQLTLSAKLLRR